MINYKNIGIIVVCDINGLIGYDGKQPIDNKADKKRFKELTQNSILIVGRKTYEALPEDKLPNRTKFIITRNVDCRTNRPFDTTEDQIPTDTRYFRGLKEVMDELKNYPENQMVYFAGGREIYRDAILFNMAWFIDLSLVHAMYMPYFHEKREHSLLRHRMDKDYIAPPTPESKCIYFPPITLKYKCISETVNPDDDKLIHIRYELRGTGFGKSWFD